MKRNVLFLVPLLIGLLAVSAIAQAERVRVLKGTEIILAFDQALSSKTATVGEPVSLHVVNDVTVAGHTILKAGTPVTATISQVDKRKRYGINAKMRIVLNPVKSTYGRMLALAPRSKGKFVGGKRSAEAAGATVGGAILLGPVGLLGGYFIVGKSVTINVGDQLTTEVTKSVTLKR